jgi:hypothetical protein
MSFLVPNAAEIRMLKFITGNDSPGTHVLRLYVNDHTPTDDDTVSDYTEASGLGYSSINLSTGGWNYATDVEGVSTATYGSVLTFSFSGGPVILYGYYVTDGSGFLLWAQRFSVASITIPAGGGDLDITPYFSLNSGSA